MVAQLSSKNKEDDNKKVLEDKQKNTNYFLYINSNNQIDIVRGSNGERLKTKNRDKDLEAGNLLISNVIDSEQIFTIKVENHFKNGRMKVDEDNNIILIFNPNFSTENNPSHIILMHEIIHVDRFMREQTLFGWATREYKVGDSFRSEHAPMEDYATVGLGGYDEWVNGENPGMSFNNPGTTSPTYRANGNVTENDIRREQGIPKRYYYTKFR